MRSIANPEYTLNKDIGYQLDLLKRLRFLRGFLRSTPSGSYHEPDTRPVEYHNEIYENNAPDFSSEGQPYRDMSQQEFEQHMSRTVQRPHSYPPDVPEPDMEEPSAEQELLSDAELIEMAIKAVKNGEVDIELQEEPLDVVPELPDDPLDETLEDMVEEPDMPLIVTVRGFDDPVAEPSLEDIVEEPMDEPDDMPEPEPEEMKPMEDPMLMNPYMPFGGFPFPPWG